MRVEFRNLKFDSCVAKTITAVTIAPIRSVFDGICNVKASNKDPNRLRSLLSAGHKALPCPIDLLCGNANDNVFRTTIEPPSTNSITSKPQPQNGERSYSLNSGVGAVAIVAAVVAAANTAIETRFLNDSSTLAIPIGSTSNSVTLVNPPKYNTMPSPNQANTILPGAMLFD